MLRSTTARPHNPSDLIISQTTTLSHENLQARRSHAFAAPGTPAGPLLCSNPSLPALNHAAPRRWCTVNPAMPILLRAMFPDPSSAACRVSSRVPVYSSPRRLSHKPPLRVTQLLSIQLQGSSTGHLTSLPHHPSVVQSLSICSQQPGQVTTLQGSRLMLQLTVTMT